MMVSRAVMRGIRSKGIGMGRTTSFAFKRAREGTASLQVLHFSSDDFKEERDEPQSMIQRVKQHLANVAMIGGAGITAFGISSIVWDMTKMFINLTPAATGYYGFIGGILTTGILGGLGYYTERWYTIRPEHVFRVSLGLLNLPHQHWREPGVGQYKAGKMRACRTDGGYWTVVGSKLTWKKPRVQLCYKVTGSHGSALVTVEATRSGFTEDIDFLCIDVHPPFSDQNTWKRVLVKGSEDRFPLADELHSYVEFKE